MAEEFDLIYRYFQPLSFAHPQLSLGIGDDGAVMALKPNHQLVVVTDTLIAGVHYPEAVSAESIGWKLLAVNLSDLAAMGAEPIGYSLGLTLPTADQNWLAGFSQGLQDLATSVISTPEGISPIPLIGGDTTRGRQTVLTLSALGQVPVSKGGEKSEISEISETMRLPQLLTRSGAQPGDLIVVSGRLGEAGLGLLTYLSPENLVPNLSEQALTQAKEALNRPVPRVALGLALRGMARSAIDISDGLIADLTHLCQASNCRAMIEIEKLPISNAVKQQMAYENSARLPLSAGDDYELCFTLPPSKASDLARIADQTQTPLTVIGEMYACYGQVESDKQSYLERVQVKQFGKPYQILEKGYAHF